jgi:hypothetical protein
VGLTYFQLAYPQGSDHWVETLSVSLEVNMTKPATVTANQLDVTVQAQLMDASGNTIDAANSTVAVSCVAVTGSSDPSTVLANVTGITRQQPRAVQLPGTGGSYSVLTTCLSGLDLSYDTTDHMFQGATAGSGINPQASGTALINATANIWDASGNQAVTATIDVGVLASTDNPPPFMVQEATVSNVGTPPPLTFPAPVGQAVALIQSFNVQYASGDHRVTWIQVGCEETSVSGSNVTLGNCLAWTGDAAGSYTDNSPSYVTLLVVAVPAAHTGT